MPSNVQQDAASQLAAEDAVDQKEDAIALKIEERKPLHGKDLIFLFISIAFVTLACMVLQLLVSLGMVSIKINGSDFYQLPIDKFADTIMYFILLFGGFEGTHSFLKSANMNKGESARLPDWKIKQLFSMLLTLIVLSIVAIVFQGIVGSTKPSFAVDNFSNAILANLIMYVSARTGSKLGENFNFGIGKKSNDSDASDDQDTNESQDQQAQAVDTTPPTTQAQAPVDQTKVPDNKPSLVATNDISTQMPMVPKSN